MVNLLTYPSEFDAAPWYCLRTTRQANVIADPHGAFTADRLIEDATPNSSHRIQRISEIPVLIVGQAYTASCFLKKGSRTWATISIHDGTDNRHAWFNLDAGTKGSVSTHLDWSAMTDEGDGWYRCSITFTAKTPNGNVYIYIAPSDGLVWIAQTDPVAYPNGIHLWNAWLNTGTTPDPIEDEEPPSPIETGFGSGGFGVFGYGSIAPPLGPNLFTHPSEFHASPWGTLRATVTADVIAGPFGDVTADKLVEQDGYTWASHRVQRTAEIPTLTIGFEYTYSVYLKKGSRDWAAISIHDGTDNRYAWFDLDNGVVGTISGALDDAAMEEAGNGWYRCSITFTAASTNGNIYINLAPSDALVAIAESDPDTYPDGIYLWHAQGVEGTGPEPPFDDLDWAPDRWAIGRFGTKWGIRGPDVVIPPDDEAPPWYPDRWGFGTLGRKATSPIIPFGRVIARTCYTTLGRVGASGDVRFTQAGEPSPTVATRAARLRAPVIYVLDKYRTPIACIDAYESFEWEDRWYDCDEWTLRVNVHAQGADAVAAGVFIAAPLPDGITRVGVIESRELGTRGTEESEVIEASGRCYGGILEGRIATAYTNVGDGYDTWSASMGSAAEGMAHYVFINVIGDAAHPVGYHLVPNLVIGPIPVAEETVRYNARFQSITEILAEIGAITGLGWRVRYDAAASVFVFEPRVGTDRTADVVFSPEYGNVAEIGFVHSTRPARTVAIVAGQGEGAARVVRSYYLERDYPTGIPTGLNLRELFVDARDIDANDEAALWARGKAKLEEVPVEQSVEFEILAGGSYLYPRDFAIGDVIRAEYPGWASSVSRIIAVAQRWDDDGKTVTATVGSEQPDVSSVLINLARKQATRGRV